MWIRNSNVSFVVPAWKSVVVECLKELEVGEGVRGREEGRGGGRTNLFRSF